MQGLPSVRPTIAAVAAAVLLAACGGGGGGGGGGSPEPDVALTATNRDTVAHTVAAAAFGFSGSQAGIPLASAAQRSAAQRAVGAVRKQAQAVIGPEVTNCPSGGTLSVTLDDRDNNNLPTPGDVITMVFSNCRESADDLVDGRIDATLVTVDVSGLISMTLDMRMSALRVVSSDETVRMNGSIEARFVEQSSSVTSTRMTADGDVTLSVTSPRFTDSVTMLDGFTQQFVDDTAFPPPPGSVNPGRARTTMSGLIESANAGGIVEVTTTTPIDQYTDDEYPRRGVIQVTGGTGQMRLTAQNADTVLVELDANGDGTYENSIVRDWSWF